jgi:hypothetical protein
MREWSPATGVRRAMSNEPVRLDGVTGWNKLMVVQVVRSIRIAHEINSYCWSLHQVKGSPTTAKLTVGKANVMRWDRGLNHFLIDAASLTDLQASIVSEVGTELYPDARELRGPLMLHVPSDRVGDVLYLFRDNHEEAVGRIAEGPDARNKRNGIYKMQFGEDLQRIVGDRHVIPKPGYA